MQPLSERDVLIVVGILAVLGGIWGLIWAIKNPKEAIESILAVAVTALLIGGFIGGAKVGAEESQKYINNSRLQCYEMTYVRPGSTQVQRTQSDPQCYIAYSLVFVGCVVGAAAAWGVISVAYDLFRKLKQLRSQDLEV